MRGEGEEQERHAGEGQCEGRCGMWGYERTRIETKGHSCCGSQSRMYHRQMLLRNTTSRWAIGDQRDERCGPARSIIGVSL